MPKIKLVQLKQLGVAYIFTGSQTCFPISNEPLRYLKLPQKLHVWKIYINNLIKKAFNWFISCLNWSIGWRCTNDGPRYFSSSSSGIRPRKGTGLRALTLRFHSHLRRRPKQINFTGDIRSNFTYKRRKRAYGQGV